MSSNHSLQALSESVVQDSLSDRIYTGHTSCYQSDYARCDGSRLVNVEDMEIFGMGHPPYITILRDHRVLKGLSPPDRLVRDWYVDMMEREDGPKALAEAFIEVDYEERYIDFLEDDMAAYKQLEKIENALEEGEVLLLCGCGEPMYQICPRRIVREYLLDRNPTPNG